MRFGEVIGMSAMGNGAYIENRLVYLLNEFNTNKEI